MVKVNGEAKAALVKAAMAAGAPVEGKGSAAKLTQGYGYGIWRAKGIAGASAAGAVVLGALTTSPRTTGELAKAPTVAKLGKRASVLVRHYCYRANGGNPGAVAIAQAGRQYTFAIGAKAAYAQALASLRGRGK